MRIADNSDHSYGSYDFGHGSSAQNWFSNWRNSANAASDSENWTQNDYRFSDARKTHERLWSNTALFAGVGFVAFIIWIATLLLKLLFPAKWTFIQGLLGIIGFVGKWVFFIAAGLIILLYVIGWFFKFCDWLRNKHW